MSRSPDFARIDEAMGAHVVAGGPSAAAWAVSVGGRAHRGAVGSDGTGQPVGPRTIFRISSMTKPITATAALMLVQDGRIGLDDEVQRWLPELSDLKVLVDSSGPLEATVPAERPITVRDVLTFRLGWGYDFTTADRQPVNDAMGDLGLGAGPPAPAGPPEPDEWIRLMGTLPLQFQPGQRWLYHVGAEVLGVLIARVAAQPLDIVLRERILDPLGMLDTGFWVPPDSIDRFGPCLVADGPTGNSVYDPTDGQWSRPPAFPSGGAGLASTVADYLSFASFLLGVGMGPQGRLLSEESVRAMTTNQLSDDQVATSGIDPDGVTGWGFGVGVQVRDGNHALAGSYGWSGGLGSTWFNDPSSDTIAVLLTDQVWGSSGPPSMFASFERSVHEIVRATTQPE